MRLITNAIRAKLMENGRDAKRGADMSSRPPVLKLFAPWCSATWLLTDCDPDDPDLLFGLCDLGAGCPEMGYVSLSEIESIRGPLGVKIERDMWFDPCGKTLGQFADEARANGRIIA